MSAAWELVVLGVMQDGGLPHPGCACDRCDAAADGERQREHVACLGLTDGQRAYLFDATPDLGHQLRLLGAGRPDGIFLTHAHIGHVMGLLYLGREALGARGVPVYATAAMQSFVRDNAPWSSLVEQGRVRLFPNESVDLGGVRVSAFQVPHRPEHSDTVGYRIEGPTRTAIYIPDIDGWDAWETDIRDLVAEVDVALLDATFLSPDEFPHRDPSEIPHPFAIDTMERLADVADRVWLTHLNHTNELLDDPAPATERGFRVAREGERIAL